MVYFSIHIAHNDIIRLQKNLPGDSFCMFQTIRGTDFYYGVVIEQAYLSLLHSLAAEALQQLEYLNENEFRNIFDTNTMKDQLFSCIGNLSLIDPFIE